MTKLFTSKTKPLEAAGEAEAEVEEGGEVALMPQEDWLGNNMEETRMGTLPARGPSQI